MNKVQTAMSIDEVISGAREVLPEAFADRETEPPARVDPLEVEAAQPLVRKEEELGPDVEPFEIPPEDELITAIAEARNFGEWLLPNSAEEFSDADREAASEAEAAHHELGFDIFALYAPFHTLRLQNRWGIFYRREGIRRLALLLMRDAKIDPTEARRAALQLLRTHERYHFRFELGALHDELVLGKPLYNRYTQRVYNRVIFTSQCFEESLANRAVTLHRFADSQLPHEDLKKFVREFCSSGPPGYCDFNRDAAEMKECLLGQLRTASPSSRIGGSEADWLANWTRHLCPEYLIPGTSFPTGKPIRCKLKGRIWIVHPSDPDPWPSKPHAHEYNRREKLHLATGEIFSVPTRTLVERLRPGDLDDLRSEIVRRRPSLTLSKMCVT